MTSFSVLEQNFSKDKNHVFYCDQPLDGVDTQSFEVMGYSWFKDKKHIYTFKAGEFVIDRENDIDKF